MIKIRTYILLAFFAPLLFSCEKYLDINEDPNSSSAIGPEYLFNYSGVALSANRNGGDNSIPLGFASQIWSTGWALGWGTGTEDTYEFGSTTLDNNWSTIYVNVGKNLNWAITIAEESVPAQVNAKAQCQILQALNLYQATVMFGDIPFSEAFSTEIAEPKFEPQKDVLDGIIALLDEAIGSIDLKNPVRIDDYYYNGDLSKWTKLAKSLKFKILMLMVDADPSKADQIKKMLTDGGMVSQSDEALIFEFIDKTGNKHPMRAIREKYYGPAGIEDMFPGKALVDIMNAHNDPRRPVFFKFGYTNKEKTTKETRYIGCESTVDRVKQLPGATSFFNGEVIWAGDKGDELFTLSEQLLLEAEAQVRFNNNLTKARELFESALEASCRRWNVSENLDDFKASFEAFSTNEIALTAIYSEFWVDQMTRPLDVWTTWRRSGTVGNEIPALTAPVNALGGDAAPENMFRSLETPPSVTSANRNAPDEVKFHTRMWFDK